MSRSDTFGLVLYTLFRCAHHIITLNFILLTTSTMPFLSLSLSLSPLSLLALLLQSTFTRATTNTTTFPSTAEVDLFFPLNQTYSPTPLFPIVFGLQNAPLFPSLDPSFELLLWNFTLGYGINATSYFPFVSLSATNFTRAETAFAYGFVTNLSAGYYSLVW